MRSVAPDGRGGGRFQRYGVPAGLAAPWYVEQETTSAVFLSTKAGQTQQQTECGPNTRKACRNMTTRVLTTWAEQLKREGTIGRFEYDHAQNLAARGTPGGEQPET